MAKRKPEQQVWDKLRPILRDATANRCDRIESHSTAPHVPDVAYTLLGDHSGWIELKADLTSDLRVGPGGHVMDLSGWTAGQRRWARDRDGSFHPVWLWVGFGDDAFLVRAGMMAEKIDKMDRVLLSDMLAQGIGTLLHLPTLKHRPQDLVGLLLE